MSLLEVEKLEVQYDKDGMKTEAVKGLSFTIEEGEIVGIVGESGCGKSSAMRALMGLYPEIAKVSCKRLYFQGKEEPVCAEKKQVPEGMAMIFQDPFSYLNPTVKIGEQIAQAIRVHEGGRKRQVKQRVCELLDMVGIRNPQKRMRQYPHELSGGMRQRVVTAVALACSPKLIIADEPTTALDVIAQGQMIGLLKKVAKETNVSILLVSHDFAVIASMCERVYVMKEGAFVEEGPTEEVFYNPQNPYTREFLQYIKEPGRKERKREAEKSGQTSKEKNRGRRRAGHILYHTGRRDIWSDRRERLWEKYAGKADHWAEKTRQRSYVLSNDAGRCAAKEKTQRMPGEDPDGISGSIRISQS